MKPFSEYLFHAQKVYEFRLKLAEVEMSEENLAKIKHALETYGVESMSKPKRLPIQEHADFPRMGPCECHIIDISLKYPTTTEQLTHIVAERALLDRARVCVKTKYADEIISDAETKDQDREKALLADTDLEDESGAQELVGQKRVTGLITELEKMTLKHEIAGKEGPASSSEEMPQGKMSPVGSRQNKIPGPVKGK